MWGTFARTLVNMREVLGNAAFQGRQTLHEGACILPVPINKFTFVLFDLQNSPFYTPTTLLLRVDTEFPNLGD